MKVKTLTDYLKEIGDTDAAIKAIHEKKRKLIEQSKVIAYGMLSDLYQLEGQELVDAVTNEHTLIGKFTASGMSYDEIGELADDNNGSKQTSFFGSNNTYTD